MIAYDELVCLYSRIAHSTSEFTVFTVFTFSKPLTSVPEPGETETRPAMIG